LLSHATAVASRCREKLSPVNLLAFTLTMELLQLRRLAGETALGVRHG
jgi:hypothetical protein